MKNLVFYCHCEERSNHTSNTWDCFNRL